MNLLKFLNCEKKITQRKIYLLGTPTNFTDTKKAAKKTIPCQELYGTQRDVLKANLI